MSALDVLYIQLSHWFHIYLAHHTWAHSRKHTDELTQAHACTHQQSLRWFHRSSALVQLYTLSHLYKNSYQAEQIRFRRFFLIPILRMRRHDSNVEKQDGSEKETNTLRTIELRRYYMNYICARLFRLSLIFQTICHSDENFRASSVRQSVRFLFSLVQKKALAVCIE